MSTPLLQSPALASDGARASVQLQQPIPQAYPVIHQQPEAQPQPPQPSAPVYPAIHSPPSHVQVSIAASSRPSDSPRTSRCGTMATLIPIIILFIIFIISGILGSYLMIVVQSVLFACMFVVLGIWAFTHRTGCPAGHVWHAPTWDALASHSLIAKFGIGFYPCAALLLVLNGGVVCLMIFAMMNGEYGMLSIYEILIFAFVYSISYWMLMYRLNVTRATVQDQIGTRTSIINTVMICMGTTTGLFYGAVSIIAGLVQIATELCGLNDDHPCTKASFRDFLTPLSVLTLVLSAVQLTLVAICAEYMSLRAGLAKIAPASYGSPSIWMHPTFLPMFVNICATFLTFVLIPLQMATGGVWVAAFFIYFAVILVSFIIPMFVYTKHLRRVWYATITELPTTASANQVVVSV